MAFLRMNAIFKYLNATPDSRCVTEGEVLSSKQLIMCGVSNIDNCKYDIVGLCLQTSALKDKPHEIKGRLVMKEGVVEVDTFKCTCKAGLSGVCKHVSACLFYCNRTDIQKLDHLTTTDLECYWNKHKSSVEEEYGPKPIDTYACIKRAKQCKPLTAEQQEECLRILRETQPHSALHKHFSRTCGGNTSKAGTSRAGTSSSTSTERPLELSEPPKNILGHAASSDVIKNLNISIANFNLKSCCSKKIELLSLQNRQAAIAVLQGSDEWKELRQLRITGSTCYSIYTYSQSNWEKKAKSLFFPKQFKSVFTEHGKKYEKAALAKYKLSCDADCDVIELGIIISHSYPWLGFSPDGVVMKNGNPIKLIEIKCPYSGTEEDATQFANSCTYLEAVDQNCNLKRKHKYYGQIQLGLALLNLKECDLVLYSSKYDSFLTIPVKFDQSFAKGLIERISFNYLKHIVHFACKKE